MSSSLPTHSFPAVSLPPLNTSALPPSGSQPLSPTHLSFPPYLSTSTALSVEVVPVTSSNLLPTVPFASSAPPHPDSQVEGEINRILSLLATNLRNVGNKLGDYTYTTLDLQAQAAVSSHELVMEQATRLKAEQAYKAEFEARMALEERLKAAEAAARTEYEARVALERRLLAAEETIKALENKCKVLEDSNRRGYEGYKHLEGQNQQLLSQLHGAVADGSIKGEELRREREARARVDKILAEAKRQNLTATATIKVLEKAMEHETDKKFVELLATEISLCQKLEQEKEDTYFAYRVQKELEEVDRSKNVKKGELERLDQELAKKLWEEENKRIKPPAVRR